MPTIRHKTDGAGYFSEGLVIGDVITNQKGSPILNASDCHQNRVAQLSWSGTAADLTQHIFTVRGTATIKAVKAGCIGACVGDSTVTVDVKKNGTTILSASISIDSGDAARDEVAGVITVAAAVAGDVFEVVVDATAGTGTLGTGLFAWVDYDEQYAAS